MVALELVFHHTGIPSVAFEENVSFYQTPQNSHATLIYACNYTETIRDGTLLDL